jgi:uncharacterized membrane protein
MADPVFIVLLVLHVGAVVAWMGGAALFVSVIMPSISKISPSSRGEFVQSALPRYIQFSAGSAVLAIIAGLALYGYATQAGPPLAPTSQGSPFIQAGAILGLIVLIIALGIMVPSGRKFVALTKQPIGPQDPKGAEIASLQKRMGIAARLGLALLGLTLILMVVGASL